MRFKSVFLLLKPIGMVSAYKGMNHGNFEDPITQQVTSNINVNADLEESIDALRYSGFEVA
jgi:hypothetical protein